jgi:hypothetical protein
MNTILTTSDVAARRGCSPATVRRLAAAAGIGRRAGRDWIFSADEAETLIGRIRDGAGNPNFGKKVPAGKPRKIQGK